MSIFSQIAVTEDGKQQKIWNTIKELAGANGETFRLLVHRYQVTFDLINRNPYGLTRLEVVSALSTDEWAKFYELALKLKVLINSAKPGTINDDVGKQSVHVSLSSSHPAAAPGEEVVFTATVASTETGDSVPTGTVHFNSAGSNLGTAIIVDGVATLSVDNLPSGTHTVSAFYSGDIKFCGSDDEVMQIIS